MKSHRKTIMWIVLALVAIALCLNGCSKSQNEGAGNTSKDSTESLVYSEIERETETTIASTVEGSEPADTVSEPENNVSEPNDSISEPAEVIEPANEEPVDQNEISIEETVEDRENEEYSPIVEDYVVELESDEVFEIG